VSSLWTNNRTVTMLLLWIFYTTLCLKNVTPLNFYNSDIHDLITIIFGRSVAKKVRNQRMLCFPTSAI